MNNLLYVFHLGSIGLFELILNVESNGESSSLSREAGELEWLDHRSQKGFLDVHFIFLSKYKYSII